MASIFRTALFFSFICACSMTAGYAAAGITGMWLSLTSSLLFCLALYHFSARLVITLARAERISPQAAPELHQLVGHLCRQANLAKPKLFLIRQAAPNLFSAGRNRRHSAVVITIGLLRELDNDELKATLAHELAHIRDCHILPHSIIAAIAGCLAFITGLVRWVMLFGGQTDHKDFALKIEETLTAAAGMPVALLLRLLTSPQCEYQADAEAARICKPEMLASTLRHLAHHNRLTPMHINPGLAHLFLVNPLAHTWRAKLFTIQPAMRERLLRLKPPKQ